MHPERRDRITPASSDADPFGSTRWSVVIAAGEQGTQARDALGSLFEIYAMPVYGFVRSRCQTADQAHDLTQGFFADLIERNTVAAADPTRGRFRVFLLTALKHFLINQHAHATAARRGGGHVIVSLDREHAEQRISASRSSQRTAEQEFERRWTLSLLDRVLQRLADEQTAAGRQKPFAALRPFLTGQPSDASQSQLGQELGLTAAAMRAAVYRLRKRYRELLRDEVAQTVQSASEVEDELQRLLSSLIS